MWPFLIGGTMMLLSLIIVIVNTSVIHILQRYFLRRNSIYILALLHLYGATSFALYELTYASPITILQRDFLPAGIMKFLNFMGLAIWYADQFLQVAMAFNRYVIIVCNNQQTFTRRRSWIFGVCAFMVASIMAFVADYITPCCVMYYNYATYSYFYDVTDFNYANYFITLPLNATCTLFACFLYCLIYIFIHRKNNAKIGISADTSRVRKAKEVHYAVQFFVITVFSTITWVAVQCFPLFIPEDKKEWMCIMSLCHLVHCIANSLIFIFYNREFKYKYFKKSEHTSSVTHVATPNDES